MLSLSVRSDWNDSISDRDNAFIRTSALTLA